MFDHHSMWFEFFAVGSTLDSRFSVKFGTHIQLEGGEVQKLP
jgi:hypothetical protein